MISPLKTAIVVAGCLTLLPAAVAVVKTRPLPALAVEQLSYRTDCAEEDNVILRMRPVGSAVRGVNILPRRPVFGGAAYRVSNAPDFSGCAWSAHAVSSATDYYPACARGYLDRAGVCRPGFAATVFSDDRWVLKGARGAHWQPFMTLIDRDGRMVGEFKSLTVARYIEPGSGGEAPEVAVLYSDGYLRPMYSARAAEPSGWGGSFILGNPRPTDQVPLRYHSNVLKVRLIATDTGDLVMELRFADDPDAASRLVLHDDYDRRGIDWLPSAGRRQLLSFVSMYREQSSFDVEVLAGDDGRGYREYPIMDARLDGAIFDSGVWLAKQNPSGHNTLAPDFQLTAR